MKVIVAGSRDIGSYSLVSSVLFDAFWSNMAPDVGDYDLEIVHGGADGVDSCAAKFCKRMDIEETVFEPDWDEHGKAAGPIRNREMAEYGDMLIAIWDGKSTGTRDMIEKALANGLDTHVRVVE